MAIFLSISDSSLLGKNWGKKKKIRKASPGLFPFVVCNTKRRSVHCCHTALRAVLTSVRGLVHDSSTSSTRSIQNKWCSGCDGFVLILLARLQRFHLRQDIASDLRPLSQHAGVLRFTKKKLAWAVQRKLSENRFVEGWFMMNVGFCVCVQV